jgi:hypothetical protein
MTSVPTIEIDSSPYRPLGTRFGTGLAISVFIHGLFYWAFVAVAFVPFMPRITPNTIVVSWSDEREYELLAAVAELEVTPPFEPLEPLPPLRPPGFVAAELSVAIDSAEERTVEENVAELAVLGKRLENVSNEASIEKMSVAMQKWFGTSERATEPATEPVEGEFDFDTAQLHDVRREKSPEDKWIFFAILLDASGRTTEVVMEPSDGERAYRAMQQLKAFPLAEKVYRQIAMSLFDKMAKAGRALDDVAKETQSQQAEKAQLNGDNQRDESDDPFSDASVLEAPNETSSEVP